MRVFFTLFMFVFIAGCNGGKPDPAPRGYVSYDKSYKSAPGEKAAKIGYSYSNEQNKTVLQDMRYAARDLAEKLDSHLSFDTDEIYLSPPADNAFYKSFDHLLRQELIHRGYLFTSGGHTSTRVDVSVSEDIPGCHIEYTEADNPYQTVYIQLALNAEKGKAVDALGGFYEVPTYGYEADNQVEVMIPPCPDVKPVEQDHMQVQSSDGSVVVTELPDE